MSENEHSIPTHLLRAFSHAELTRREMEERTGETIGFGRLLGELHRADLPLPRFPVTPDSPGIRMIKQLTERAMAHGR